MIDYEGARKVDGAVLARLRVGFAEAGDVILTHKGTVGRVAVCDRSCVLTPQTTYYRADPLAFDATFLALQLQSPWFVRQYSANKNQTTRDHLTIERQYRLFLALPPREEQVALAAAAKRLLSFVDCVGAPQSNAYGLLGSLGQSILAKAFRGELVPQDPTDEPASVLLERLRAARETTAEPKRPGKRPRKPKAAQ